VLDITYPATEGNRHAGCEAALARLAAAAEQSVADGYNILILSDRNVDAGRVAIPALLACSGVHHALVRQGLRTSTGLVVDTGSARETHHFALLAGYGAEAVCPWLALETIKDFSGEDYKESQKKYVKAVGKGLNKVMSKMGISTYQSYCGAQIFEAVGLNSDFIRRYFTGTVSQVEGVGLKEVAEEAVRTHRAAFQRSGAGHHAGRRRRVRLPRPRRGAHVDAGCHRQAPARHPRQPVLPPTRNTPPSSTTRASAT
jgi:glutamate synthase (NADPH/NADH) large chain